MQSNIYDRIFSITQINLSFDTDYLHLSCRKRLQNGIKKSLFLSITSLALSLNVIPIYSYSSDLFLDLHLVSFLSFLLQCLYSFSEIIFRKSEAHLSKLSPLKVLILKLKLFNFKQFQVIHKQQTILLANTRASIYPRVT